MQYINLLPPEMRPKATTPLKIIVTLYIGVALNFSLLMWALFGQFAEIPREEDKVSALDAQIKIMEADAKYHDKLKKEIEQLENKDKIVQSIKRERVKWARKLDLLWDVISSSRTSWVSGYSIGYDTLNVKRKGKRKGVDYILPSLRLTMWSSYFEQDPKILDMNAETLINDFLVHYKSNDELVRDFEVISPTKWSFDDESWDESKKIIVKYDLQMRALPFDEELQVRKVLE